MLELQKFLHKKGIKKLESKLKIKVYRHPTLPLVGFKYNQIDSPRTHPVVRECRGIVLEDQTWDLVAKPFNRFFNVGEIPEEFADFDWTNFCCMNKVDGSLIILYHYNGEWHANTSGSFGLGEAPRFNGTWRDLFWQTFGEDKKERLWPEFTYIFELCTPYNRVVKDYGAPTVFLLGANKINRAGGIDFSEDYVARFASQIGCKRTAFYHVESQAEVVALLQQMEDADELEEGVVIRDRNMRFKWKTKKYLALHRLNDNGNILLSRNLLTIVLTGEVPETTAYFPVSNALNEVQTEVDKLVKDIDNIWFTYGDMASQKKFAMKVKDHPFSSVLFQMRKELEWDGTSQDEYIRKYLLSTAKQTAEKLFGKRIFQFDEV